MLTPKWTTSRWRLPGRLRRERLRQLLSKSDLEEIFGNSFIEGLEKRKESLERVQWRLIAIQVPLFLFLAFSLLKLDVNLNVLGISAGVSQKLREVLLLLSTTFGVISATMNRELGFVKEMMKAFIEKQSGTDNNLKEFLEARYGLSLISPLQSFDSDLIVGKTQFVGFIIWIASGLVFVGMLILMAVAVQFLNLIEIYLNPNVSRGASFFVIAYVVLGDVIALGSWLLAYSVQPYQTYEDFRESN